MCPEKNDECDVSGVFAEAVERYMEEYDQVYSESTVKDRRRELMRLCRLVGDLREEGRVSTADPGDMTAQDVKEVAVALKASGVAVNTRVHALGRLNLLCKFCGNMCVEHAKVRYPALFPSKRETRLGVLSRSDVERIFSCAEAAEGFTELRMHLSVAISLGAGLRPQEVRFVSEDDFSEDLSELTVTHPKGADTFGEVRTVPVHPRTSAVACRYLELFRSRGMSGYLFQGPHGEPVAGNTQRLWRSKVVEETGVDFDHRALRRTWGQGLLDAGCPRRRSACCWDMPARPPRRSTTPGPGRAPRGFWHIRCGGGREVPTRPPGSSGAGEGEGAVPRPLRGFFRVSWTGSP